MTEAKQVEVDKNFENFINYTLDQGGFEAEINRLCVWDDNLNKLNYKKEFHKCRNYLDDVQNLIYVLEKYGIETRWFFFEPYIELTWVNNIKEVKKYRLLMHELAEYCKKNQFTMSFHLSKDNSLADWYCCSAGEREFGYKAYECTANISLIANRYQDYIKAGKGLEQQYKRRLHAMANQMGFNFRKEGWMLLERGILALLFSIRAKRGWMRKVLWFWEKILRLKY